MKRIIFVICAMVLVIGFVNVFSVYAQEPVVSGTKETNSEYALPYPGILPGHPLYFLKKFRDTILEKLITDPIRKIEFYILQSDKEINTAVFLSSQDKKINVNEAVARAVQFKEKAIAEAKIIKEQGKVIPEFIIERLAHSLQKQSDIQKDLEKNAQASQKPSFSQWNQTVSKLTADVDILK